MPLEVSHQTREKGLEVVLAGRLEARDAPDLADWLAELLHQPPRGLVFDLSGLDYICTAGLSLLLQAFETVSLAEGTAALAGAEGQVAESLELSGLGAVFTLAENAEQAWTQI